MKMHTVHIIHLQKRDHSPQRMANIVKQVSDQKLVANLWPGIVENPVCTGIAKAHKQIVVWAKKWKLPDVCIMEDDVSFLGAGAFEYFISNQPELFDIYLGTASNVLKRDGHIIKDFRGMLLYMVHERFYDTFLSLPENMHIDAALKDKGDYYLCDRVVVEEAPGYSYNRKQVLDRRRLINQFEKYNAGKDSNTNIEKRAD